MLKAKDLSPKHNESMYELGYLLIGRPAIFLICIVNFLYCSGLLMMYFIIFGDTMGEIISQIVTGEDISGIMRKDDVKQDLSTKNILVQAMCTRSFLVLLSASILAPVLYKKEMTKMKNFSYLLFFSIVLTVTVTGYSLIT